MSNSQRDQQLYTPSRRIKFWVKNSFASIHSSSRNLFDDDDDEDCEDSTLNHSDNEEEETGLIHYSSCHTIDDAMRSLYDSSCRAQEEEENSMISMPTDDACTNNSININNDMNNYEYYDWLLDGEPEWAAEFEKRGKLKLSLKQLELEDPSLSIQDAAFHVNFEDDGVLWTITPRSCKEEKEEVQQVDDNDDEFGDFVSATPPPPKQSVNEEESESCNDDGNEQNTTPRTQQTTTLPPDANNDAAIKNSTPKQGSCHELAPKVEEENNDKDNAMAELKPWWSKTDQEMQEDLPQEYCTSTHSATMSLLRNLPWNHVPFLSNNGSDNATSSSDDDDEMLLVVVEEHVTQLLSQLDAAHTHVKKRLMDEISQRHDFILQGNELVHEMDHNLAMAQLNVRRGLQGLQQAQGQDDLAGLLGMNALMASADRREELKLVQNVLDQCAKLLEQEAWIHQQMDEFGTATFAITDQDAANRRFQNVLEVASNLEKTLQQDDEMKRLVCLDSFRIRVGTIRTQFQDRIVQVLSQSTSRWCHSSFHKAEYETLRCAMQDTTNAGTTKNKEVDATQQQWTQCILESLCNEADTCLARALLDPYDDDDETIESEFETELGSLSLQLQHHDTATTSNLQVLIYNLATIRFGLESNTRRNHLARVYYKTCMFLTNVLHTHYMICKHHESKQAHESDDETHEQQPEAMISDDSIPEEKKTEEHHHVKDSKESSPSTHSTICLDGIHSELVKNRLPLWNHCETVLVSCVDQYLTVSPKKKFFHNPNDDEEWLDDLQQLEDIWQLTLQFLRIGKEFTSLANVELNTILKTKLRNVFQRHLRSIHVDAMNSTGAMLAKERWNLESCQGGDDDDDGTTWGVKKCILSMLNQYTPTFKKRQRCWHNVIHTAPESEQLLAAFSTKGNPFMTDKDNKVHSCRDDLHIGDLPLRQEDTPDRKRLYETMSSFLDSKTSSFPALCTQSSMDGLVQWTSRLMAIVQRLPLIFEDVTIVITNLYDLYFTTVFRLCAGSAKNERILLGVESTPRQPHHSTKEVEDQQPHKRHSFSPEMRRKKGGFSPDFKRANSSGLFHRPRRASNKPPPCAVHVTEADICAPLPIEFSEISQLSTFLQQSQKDLSGIVNLDKIDQWMVDPSAMDDDASEGLQKATRFLERRTAAAWSCLFVAALLDTAWQCMNHVVVNNEQDCDLPQDTDDDDDDNHACPQPRNLSPYVMSVVKVAPRLASLGSRIACARALSIRNVVQEIVSVECWSESTVHVDSNDYTHHLTTKCTAIQDFLSDSELPSSVMEKTLQHLASACFVAILEGFATVCSHLVNFPAEGVALMSMDVVAFESGLAEAEWPISTRRHLVSEWITALYLPDSDLMEWIERRYKDYQGHVMLALISSNVGNDERRRNAQGMAEQVKSLYSKYANDHLCTPPTTPHKLKRYNTC